MVYSGNGVGLTLENICDGADNKCYITPMAMANLNLLSRRKNREK